MKHVIKNRLRSVVIVTLKDGSSFGGVLFDTDSEAFVLRNAEHLVVDQSDQAQRSVLVDGELVVLVADVAYIQIP